MHHILIRSILIIALSALTITARASITTNQTKQEDWLTFIQALQKYKGGQEEIIAALKLRSKESFDQDRYTQHLLSAINKGHPCAHLLMVPQANSKSARIDHLRFAAKYRIKDAAYPLADHLYKHGSGKPVNYGEALRLFTTAGAWKHKDACFYAGRMYHFGHGTEEAFEEARHWYQLAVDYGSVRAGNNLANLWRGGIGGPRNLPKAIELLEYASSQGMTMATGNLAEIYENEIEGAPDWVHAERYYRQMFEQNRILDYKAEGAYNLGRISEFGYLDGIIDTTVAADYYTIASNLNYSRASVRLGRFYRDGDGVTRNVYKARELFESAAAAGNREANYLLGLFYDKGLVGPPDLSQAISYYRKAADKGHINAMNNLAWNLWRQEPRDYEEIERNLRKSIEGSNIQAINNLGYYYLSGEWPDADFDEGFKLIEQAARKDNEFAINNMVKYYEGRLGNGTADAEKAAYWKSKQHSSAR